MPRFNFSDAEVNELTDYIMTVYQNPEIDLEWIRAHVLVPGGANDPNYPGATPTPPPSSSRNMLPASFAVPRSHFIRSSASTVNRNDSKN